MPDEEPQKLNLGGNASQSSESRGIGGLIKRLLGKEPAAPTESYEYPGEYAQRLDGIDKDTTASSDSGALVPEGQAGAAESGAVHGHIDKVDEITIKQTPVEDVPAYQLGGPDALAAEPAEPTTDVSRVKSQFHWDKDEGPPQPTADSLAATSGSPGREAPAKGNVEYKYDTLGGDGAPPESGPDADGAPRDEITFGAKGTEVQSSAAEFKDALITEIGFPALDAAEAEGAGPGDLGVATEDEPALNAYLKFKEDARADTPGTAAAEMANAVGSTDDAGASTLEVQVHRWEAETEGGDANLATTGLNPEALEGESGAAAAELETAPPAGQQAAGILDWHQDMVVKGSDSTPQTSVGPDGLASAERGSAPEAAAGQNEKWFRERSGGWYHEDSADAESLAAARGEPAEGAQKHIGNLKYEDMPAGPAGATEEQAPPGAPSIGGGIGSLPSEGNVDPAPQDGGVGDVTTREPGGFAAPQSEPAEAVEQYFNPKELSITKHNPSESDVDAGAKLQESGGEAETAAARPPSAGLFNGVGGMKAETDVVESKSTDPGGGGSAGGDTVGSSASPGTSADAQINTMMNNNLTFQEDDEGPSTLLPLDVTEGGRLTGDGMSLSLDAAADSGPADGVEAEDDWEAPPV
jgi:hypothetical protein